MTIRGKSLEDIISELSEYKPPTKLLMDKYPYYKIEEYEECLNRIVGAEHYLTDYEEMGTIKIALTDQIFLQMKCRITLIDDEGRPCLYKTGIGSKALEYSSLNNIFINLNNITYCCQQAAFKSACKGFGMFGIHGEECNEDSKDQQKYNKEECNYNSKNRKNTLDMKFINNGSMIIMRQNDNKPVYKLAVHEVVGNQCRQEIREILFYPNQYKNWEKELNSLIQECQAKKAMFAITVSISSRKPGKDVYIFKGFRRRT